MSYLRICDLAKQPDHEVVNPAIDFKFPLDIFQKHAISAIDQQHNILCCAKTGSGKTLVGEYQIAESLRNGGRVFYTTPIKSLSNQKFHDMKQLYPENGKVGIMTGDIKFCPDAKIIIMTTEILRNLLYKQGTKTENLGITSQLSLKGLDAVIFDECHYINDKDRGKVWEETMILLDPSIKLVMLSATLDRPDLFANWLGELKKRPIHLIETQYRVVPLQHCVMMRKQTHTIMDAKEIFNDQTYNDWYKGRIVAQKEKETFQKKVHDARRSGVVGAIAGKVTVASFKHQLNETIESLNEKTLLPALAFVFSRKDCEVYAKSVENDLLDSSDSSLSERIFDFHLSRHKTDLETIPQYHVLRRLITKGIAFHHSGLLPLLKEALEILFSKGLIKLMFCTETFAVGINMPTKTVLFLSLSKYDDRGIRLLRTDEYIQMAGRAGRRGKDTFGTVIYLPHDEPPSVSEMRLIMKGGKPEIQSRMDFHYDFLLKSLQQDSNQWLSVLHQSYWYRQHMIQLQVAEKQLGISIKNEETVRLDPLIAKEMTDRFAIEETIKTTTNAARRVAQRQLEQWKNMHAGPKWANAEFQWKTWTSAKSAIDQCRLLVKGLTDYKSPVENCLNALVKFEYAEKIIIDSKETIVLNEKGIMASECNETHPFLSVEIYKRGLTKNLTADELIILIASMINDKQSDNDPSLASVNVSKAVKDGLYTLDSIAAEFQEKEDAIRYSSPDGYWRLSTYWLEPVAKWISGQAMSAICVEYGIFEGNFVRSILKLANCVDEWIAMATYCEDTQLLLDLEGTRGKLIREILAPDSLYLHL